MLSNPNLFVISSKTFMYFFLCPLHCTDFFFFLPSSRLRDCCYLPARLFKDSEDSSAAISDWCVLKTGEVPDQHLPDEKAVCPGHQ